jgi:prepilin-type N-terminal cleavage/methylation domain-containing protein
MISSVNATRTQRPAFLSRARRAVRTGFTLVEVIVALALFGISMSAIAALTFAVSRQAVDTEATTERTAVLEARINDLYSIPWTSIDARIGCTTITAQPFPRTECIAVANTSASRKNVTLTVTPTDVSIHPTSAVVERTRPPAGNPFNVAP